MMRPHARVERIEKDPKLSPQWYTGTLLWPNNDPNEPIYGNPSEVWVCWDNGLHTWISREDIKGSGC